MPIAQEELKEMLEKSFPGATIQVTDTAGDQDHYDVKLIWQGFLGKSLIEQHRMVNQVIAGKNIHAVSIKTSVN